MASLKESFRKAILEMDGHSTDRAQRASCVTGTLQLESGLAPATDGWQHERSLVTLPNKHGRSVHLWLERISRPVTLFFNGKGDHILTLPTLRALVSLFPGRMTLICHPGAHKLYFSDLDLLRVVETPFWSGNDGAHEFDARAVAEAVGDCELFVSLVPWHHARTDELVRLLKPTFSIGFHQHFTSVVPHVAKHAADSAFDLPRHLNPSLTIEHYATPPSFHRSALNRALLADPHFARATGNRGPCRNRPEQDVARQSVPGGVGRFPRPT
jgi:hypothetical protein